MLLIDMWHTRVHSLGTGRAGKAIILSVPAHLARRARALLRLAAGRRAMRLAAHGELEPFPQLERDNVTPAWPRGRGGSAARRTVHHAGVVHSIQQTCLSIFKLSLLLPISSLILKYGARPARVFDSPRAYGFSPARAPLAVSTAGPLRTLRTLRTPGTTPSAMLMERRPHFAKLVPRPCRWPRPHLWTLPPHRVSPRIACLPCCLARRASRCPRRRSVPSGAAATVCPLNASHLTPFRLSVSAARPSARPARQAERRARGAAELRRYPTPCPMGCLAPGRAARHRRRSGLRGRRTAAPSRLVPPLGTPTTRLLP